MGVGGPIGVGYHRRMSGSPSRREIMALAMVHKLYQATCGNLIQWRSVTVLATKPEHVDALQVAVLRGWIELSPDGHNVCLTAKGHRLTSLPPSLA
jgi:hypothetical protein